MVLMVALAGGSIGVTLALQDRALWQDLEGEAVAGLEGAASGSRETAGTREQAVRYAAVARTPEFRANPRPARRRPRAAVHCYAAVQPPSCSCAGTSRAPSR
jgi:hypothetical protein